MSDLNALSDPEGTLYKIVRIYEQDHPSRVIKRKLTISEAQAWVRNKERSSSTCKLAKNIRRTKLKGKWFDSMDIDS